MDHEEANENAGILARQNTASGTAESRSRAPPLSCLLSSAYAQTTPIPFLCLQLQAVINMHLLLICFTFFINSTVVVEDQREMGAGARAEARRGTRHNAQKSE